VDEERLATLKALEDRLGYWFKEIAWLDQALTHKSFIYETSHPEKVSNEVLEFLGDAVLNLAASHLLRLCPRKGRTAARASSGQWAVDSRGHSRLTYWQGYI
jgi:dsRNA-specific ribonuclease